MVGTVLRSRAWGLSIAVHAAIGLGLALFLGAGHPRHELHSVRPPTRLVWVEPATQPRGAPSAPAGAAVPSTRPVSEPGMVAEPRRPEAAPVPPLTRAGATRPSQRARRRAAPVRSVVPAAPATVDAPSSEMAGPAHGEDSGATTGVAGGVTGGLGDAPLALAAVASPPELLERVVPEYPSRARALAIEGQVVLEVVLDLTGRPEPDIRVLRSVALLDAAAVTAVKQWRFRPARDAVGRPVRVVMEVPVRFVLR